MDPSAAAPQKAINVQVAVRCRPPNSEEKKTNQPTVVQCETEAKQIKVSYGPAGKKVSKTFSFDRVFGMYSTQDQIFDSMVRPIIEETVAGFNCTIFAYGQTGTGKTHTMEGNINVPEEAGIVPRSANAIIEQLEASGAEYTIRVSFLELYNEELQDLLAEGSSTGGPLRLCEDTKKGGVVCQNLEEVTVLNANDIFEILQRGIKRRQTAETLLNKNSSRSHSIFTLKIMIKEMNVEGEDVVRHGQLNLVDLAGSECVGRSGAKNDRAREAGSINQSLLTLGRVITALVDHHGHIPYRDSKLTRILQESLGGRAKTCIIATLSPSQLAVEESLSTLDYAHRAKNIKNRPEVNQKMTKRAVLKEYGAEIENLRLMLQLTREKNGVYLDPAQFEAMEARLQSQESQLLECESALKERLDELKQLRSEREMMEEQLTAAKTSLEETTTQLDDVTKTLEETTENLLFTRVELEASDTVIGEQVTTESSLTECGQDLKSKISSHRVDIDLLHGKVDRHSNMEQRRIFEADSFQNEVVVLQEKLVSEVSAMKKTSESESQQLCSGVGALLSQGKDTCNSLQSAIDGALGVLLADAGNSRDTMTASCDGVQVSLQHMGTSAAGSLTDLQQKLSVWIRDLEVGMTNVINHMTIQQKEIEELKAQVLESRKSQENLKEHLTELHKQRNDSTYDTIRLNAFTACESIKTFKEGHQSTVQKQEEFVKAKTGEMEQAMVMMMQQFQSSLTSMIAQSCMSTVNFCEQMENTQTKNQNTTIAEVEQTFHEVEGNINSLEELNSKMTMRVISGLKTIDKSRECSNSDMTVLIGSVPEKQALLGDTTATVIESIKQTVSDGCDSVRQTSEMANTILTNVQSATNQMNESTSASLDSFTNFMNDAGETLKQELGKHFENLEVFLSHQEQVSSLTIDEAVKFKSKSADSVVVPTGTTPRKVPFSPLKELSSTRNHNIIKDEVRVARKRKAVEENENGLSAQENTLENELSANAETGHGTIMIESLACNENENPQDEKCKSVSSSIIPDVSVRASTRATKIQRPKPAVI